jgi:hypothetical protein
VPLNSHRESDCSPGGRGGKVLLNYPKLSFCSPGGRGGKVPLNIYNLSLCSPGGKELGNVPLNNPVSSVCSPGGSGDFKEPSTTQTFGVFRLVFSNKVFYQNLLLGTINSQTAYISTDFVLHYESSGLTITYQDGAIQNTSKTPPQTLQNRHTRSHCLF